jgi:HSP20 family protein
MIQDITRRYYLFSPPSWVPLADLYENDQEVLIVVDVAGVDRDQLKVTLDGRTLSITGKRQSPAPSGSVRIHQMEIDVGEFRRRIPLPEAVIFDKSRCSYRDGLLTVVLAKKSKADVVHVPIDTE